jgi:hypothetical protein
MPDDTKLETDAKALLLKYVRTDLAHLLQLWSDEPAGHLGAFSDHSRKRQQLAELLTQLQQAKE